MSRTCIVREPLGFLVRVLCPPCCLRCLLRGGRLFVRVRIRIDHCLTCANLVRQFTPARLLGLCLDRVGSDLALVVAVEFRIDPVKHLAVPDSLLFALFFVRIAPHRAVFDPGAVVEFLARPAQRPQQPVRATLVHGRLDPREVPLQVGEGVACRRSVEVAGGIRRRGRRKVGAEALRLRDSQPRSGCRGRRVSRYSRCKECERGAHLLAFRSGSVPFLLRLLDRNRFHRALASRPLRLSPETLR